MRRAELGALAALLLAGPGGAAAPSFPPARPLVPYAVDGDVGCQWTMHDKSEHWIRGGIGRGEIDPQIDFVDRVFFDWSDSQEHQIEVSVGDPERRVSARALASNAGGQIPGSLQFVMTSELRKLIGGATSLQIWKDGRPVFNTRLANTPSTAELDECVRPPRDPDHDDEE